MPRLYRPGEASFYDWEDRETTYKLHICCHCNVGIIIKPGSGRERGYCYGCHNITCGAAKCYPCIPWEAKMEAAEGTRQFWKGLEIGFRKQR
jgi:hypothetical protein